MIESPKNFIEQFQNFIEHIAGVMKTFLTKEIADSYYLGKSEKAVSADSVQWEGIKSVPDNIKNALSFTTQTLNEAQKMQARTNIGAISLNDVPSALSMYPVGSIYMSADANFNPNTQFGGTWVKIENRFLLGSGWRSVGNTGGEENVTLNINQIPAHTHYANSFNSTGTLRMSGTAGFESANGAFSISAYSKKFYDSSGSSVAKMASLNTINAMSGELSWAGGNGSHNNMPPYQVVAIWQRTA